MPKIDSCLIVGAGGTGSLLIEPLCKLLYYHENGTVNIGIIDCDEYEEGNHSRQIFRSEDLGRNKAQATYERLVELYPCIQYFPVRADDQTFESIVDKIHNKSGNLLVILCVDNFRTRNILQTCLDKSVPNFFLINPGNEEETAMSSTYAVVNSEGLNLHPFDRYDEFLNPTDRMPGSCEGIAVESPQTIIANFSAAMMTLSHVYRYLQGEEQYNHSMWSLSHMKMNSLQPYNV